MAANTYRGDVAEEMIRQIEAGTAPWQKPWKPGVFRSAPFNPTHSRDYRGINSWWLDLQGYSDPRWLTYRQATEAGVQVRKGEKGTSVEYWQWSEQKPLLDAAGQPLIGEDGKRRTVSVRLARPNVFYARVFNAEQIDGLEPLVVPEPDWKPDERAQAIVEGTGIAVHHDQGDRAFYSVNRDQVHMPTPAAFGDTCNYYATLLHELGHASGHETRLARAFGPFGSEAYAKEELRAEMASFLLTTELGLGHDPGRHAAYVESWLKVLKDDRNLLFRAARDAERIRDWVMEPQLRPELEKSAQQARAAVEVQEKEMDGMEKESRDSSPATTRETGRFVAQDPAISEAENKPRVYLAVPYAEKDEAKQLGARWDRKAKSWYVPAALDQAAFGKWIGDAAPKAPSVSPQDEFAEACRTHGLVLNEPPVMDGRWHRVQVEDDKRGQKSGSYKGYIDGRPSGLIMNYRSGDDVQKWVATGEKLDPAELERLKAESAKRKAALNKEIGATRKKVAKMAFGIFENAPGAPADHPYLERKGIGPGDLRCDDNGHLLVPMRTADGFLMNVQKITADGTKRFLKQGRKQGLMHILAGDRDDGPLVIAEGYATAASLHHATGLETAVAFNAGNLEAVARAIRKQHPERTIVIAADDDHTLEAQGKKNVGLEKARAAAKAVGATVAIPAFTEDEKARGMTDFNDVERTHGPEPLRKACAAAIERSQGLSRRTGHTVEKDNDRHVPPGPAHDRSMGI